MRKLLRVLAWTIGGLAAILVAALALLAFLLTTQPGAALVVRYVEGKLPIDLAVADVDGRLVGPLELGGAKLALNGVRFEVDRMIVDWRPIDLLQGQVHLESVAVDGLRLTTGREREEGEEKADSLVAAETTEPDTSPISLPIELVLRDVHLSNGSLSIPDVLEAQEVVLRTRGTAESYTAEITAKVELLDFPAMQISLAGDGSLNSFTLESLKADALDGELRAQGSVSWMPEVAWEVAVQGDTLVPASLAPDPADWPGRLSISASTRGGLNDGRPSIRIEVDTLRGSLRDHPINGRLSGGIEASEYDLTLVDLDWGTIRIDAAGSINRQQLAVEFEVEAPDIGTALPRASGSVSATGNLAGTPSSPQIKASLLARDVLGDGFALDSARAVVDLDWAARSRSEARMTLTGLAVANQAVDSLDLTLRGTRESHELTARIASNMADIAFSARGALRGERWEGEIRDIGISNDEVGDWHMDGAASLTAAKTSAELEETCLIAEEGHLCVGGSWSSDGGWQVASSLEKLPLTLLDPFMPARWSLPGHVSGELRANGAAARVEAANVDTLYLVADGGHLIVDGSWSSESGWQLTSTLEQVPLTLLDPLLPEGWALTGHVSGELGGNGAGRHVEGVDAEIRAGSATLERTSAERVDELRFSASRIAIRAGTDSVHGEFTIELADPNQASAGTLVGHAFLPSVNILTREVASEGLAEALQDDWQLSLSIDSLALPLFDRFLPERTRLIGSLDGSLSASAAIDGELTAQLDVIPENAALQRTAGDAVSILQFVEPSIYAQVDSDGFRGRVDLAAARPDSTPHAALSGTIELPQYTNLSQAIRSQVLEARVTGEIDLSLFDAFLDKISETEGRFDADLAIRGTVAENEVSGQYRIHGQTDLPSLGVQLREIELTAAASPEGHLAVTGGLASGDGRLHIEGNAPIIPSQEQPGRLTIRGDRFLAMQGDQTTLVVSPNLEIVWTGTTIDVTGEVAIPLATVEIIEIPETAVPVSDDVVLLGEDTVPKRPLDVSANVQLILGDAILFKGFGFTTYLDGSLQLTEQPGIPTQGRGELVLREGVYRGYGQNLTIDPGRLVFAGPIDDPTVGVRAYRRATDGVRAGFVIGGTLQSLDVEVWSDPAMSESSVLSYVLFGRSAEQSSDAQQAQAGSAAALLGGNILAMSMASRVGLDDARIEAGARQQDAAFYAGKYLSPQLYVAYGVGLFEPIDVIRVRYLISRKLTLQAETGSRDSGDILYRIEH
jgi:autotransporter translocation and assembly factor TamB